MTFFKGYRKERTNVMPNNIKLLTIQEAANQLGLTVNKFLEYVDTIPPTEEIKSIDGGFYKVENRVTIGAKVAGGKIYHLNRDDICHFMNGHSILKVKFEGDFVNGVKKRRVVYPEYYEYEKKRNPAPEIPWSKARADYEIPIAGLRIPESEFSRQKEELIKNGILPEKQEKDLSASTSPIGEIPQTGYLTFNGKKLKLQKQHYKLLNATKKPTEIKNILNDVFGCEYTDKEKIKQPDRNRFDVAKSKLNSCVKKELKIKDDIIINSGDSTYRINEKVLEKINLT